MYKCIKGFSIEKCDDDGFDIEGEYFEVEKDSIWHIPEEEDYRLLGGEIRLESNSFGWIEIPLEYLKEYFEVIC